MPADVEGAVKSILEETLDLPKETDKSGKASTVCNRIQSSVAACRQNTRT
jgi:hypothetical protein